MRAVSNGVLRSLCFSALGVFLSGCATSLQEIQHHPQEERLERLLAQILPHTEHPEKHYWVRVSEPTTHQIGLTVLPHRHVYLSASLLEEADDVVVLALLAHGVAHHRLHHYTKRGALRTLQRAAFKAGGFFVPGLGHGHYVGDPLTEVVLSAGQEPSADSKTVTYLIAIGHSEQALIRALEFMMEHGYAERVGRIVTPSKDFASRIARLRRANAHSSSLQ